MTIDCPSGLEPEVLSNGKTVWINGTDGSCVGRFSKFGIDLHRTVTEQMAGMPECLDCTHDQPGLAEWQRFQAGVKHHYGVIVDDKHCPDFVRTGRTWRSQ